MGSCPRPNTRTLLRNETVMTVLDVGGSAWCASILCDAVAEWHAHDGGGGPATPMLLPRG